MSSLTVAQRAIGAVVGGIIADAAALPIHWIYDVGKLDEILSGHKDPEFLPKSHCPFYTLPTGRNSCYGDQTYALLKSLVECKGFDKAHYKQTLNEIFGANSEYEFDLGRPLEKSDYPVNAAWRNGSIKGFLAASKEGKDKTGVDDSQSDCLGKVAPLVALYAGDAKLLEIVEDVVRVTQDNDIAVACALGASKLLEHMVLNGPDGAVAAAQSDCSDEVVAHIQEAVKEKDANHRDVVKKFGSSCQLPGNFKNCVHVLATSPGDFTATVRATMTARGDNCSRLTFVGSCMGTYTGLAGLPQDWISRTTRGSDVITLTERLVELRK